MKINRLVAFGVACGVIFLLFSESKAGSVRFVQSKRDSGNLAPPPPSTDGSICPDCNQPMCEWKSKTHVPVTVWGEWEKRCYEWRDECGRLVKKEVWVRCHRDEWQVIEESSPPLKKCCPQENLPRVPQSPPPTPSCDHQPARATSYRYHRHQPLFGIGARVTTPLGGVGANVGVSGGRVLRYSNNYLPVY